MILTPIHVRRCLRPLVALVVALAGCIDEPQGTGVSYADRLAEADVHFAAGRFDEALGLYEAFLDGDPSDVPYGRLHRTYLALGLSTRARALKLRRRADGLPVEYPGAWHCDMGMIAIQAVRFRLEAAEDVEGTRTWYDGQRDGLGDAFAASLEEEVKLIAESFLRRVPRSRPDTVGHTCTGSRTRCTIASTMG